MAECPKCNRDDQALRVAGHGPQCFQLIDELPALKAQRQLAGEIITVKMMRREDGGLRIWGEPPGGLILSGHDPERVIAAIWPALGGLEHPITK